jgi:bifunctional non-homologous end joining protein LigD
MGTKRRRSPGRGKRAAEAAAPQLASLAAAAPDGPDWIHEIKFDGYRLAAVRRRGGVRLVTRNGKDWTDRFPSIAAAVEGLPGGDLDLDGEVAVLGPDGVTSFQRLQNHLRDGRDDLLYFVFDLLRTERGDLRQDPLTARKALLADLLKKATDPLRYSEHVSGKGPAFFAQACRHGLEGIISKRGDAPYRSGRGRDWLKVKCGRRQEFAVVGYTQPAGTRVGIGALVIGARSGDGELRYAGRVGTGFSDRVLWELRRRLSGSHVTAPPVVNPPGGRAGREIQWVEPELVAEISYTDWTDEGVLRHPSYQGLREDKSVDDVWIEAAEPVSGHAAAAGAHPKGRSKVVGKRSGARSAKRPAVGRAGSGRRDEAVAVAGVRLTSPHKVLYAQQGITKLDLARYYEAVADWMLPYVAGRPLTLVRCPAGRDGHCFYQKHMDPSADSAIRRVRVDAEPDAQPYGAVDSVAGLVALVQMGVLEIHTWGSRRDRLEQPDRITFDLDPDEGLPWPRIVAAALEVRDFLGDLGLESFLKTTGGKGLHLVVPVRRKGDWDEVKEFARAVSAAIAEDAPGRYTTNISKAKRKGRVLIDYLRNGRGATAVEAFSTRARAGAPVSAPIRWDELTPRLRSDRFDVRSLPRRLASLRNDPWADYRRTSQAVTLKMKRAVGMKA